MFQTRQELRQLSLQQLPSEQTSGTPLLHITGEVDSNYIGTDQRYIHEAKDQLKMMEGVNKAAYLLKRPKQITPYMRQAIKEALSVPTGPVTIAIPTNFQAQIIPQNQLIEVETIQNQEVKMDIPDIIAEMISEAKRPIVWAGNGVVASGATEELQKLVDKIQPAVVTSESGKGSIPENYPLCIGNFTFTPQVEKLLERSDLLISIGVHFRGWETNGWTSPVPKNHINIDLNSHAFNRSFDTLYTLNGDAKKVLQAINDALVHKEIKPDATYVEEVRSVRLAVRNDLRIQIGPYGEIVDIMREQLPENTILVTDVTIPGYTWGNKLFDIYEPRNYLYMTGGGIGQGLPMAIGAKIGQPNKPVVLIAGDGGFMVNVGELITAIQENTPIIVLLFDDGGYGILRYYQEAAYGRRTSVDLKNPDFVMLAKSMGFESERVHSVEEFKKGLENAVRSKKPYMVVVDVEAVGVLEYKESEEYIESFRPQHG
ncbi:hypothetical protein JK635_22170 [Neobacillus sp. YIM B02564]|uniref:Thiamine pyrophosphate-binding protein n=1 Tax=Neobacillus paridis TaxID=2803862 RepID=A0ABS1TWD4_9BACI|nr:hypothetical protein [Neobacillus paridis]